MFNEGETNMHNGKFSNPSGMTEELNEKLTTKTRQQMFYVREFT